MLQSRITTRRRPTLVLCTYNGDGVSHDYARALSTALVYRKLAADQGNERAKRDVAHQYYNGEGVPEDYAKARGYYSSIDSMREMQR